MLNIHRNFLIQVINIGWHYADSPCSIGVHPPLILGIRSLESFEADGLVTYRAVASGQDPPFLRGAPSVHTRSFALTVRWNLNRPAAGG